MDLTSILPLLMGGKNPEMAKVLSAMSNPKSDGGGMNDMLASILAGGLANKSSAQNGGSSKNTSGSDGDKGEGGNNPFSALGGEQTQMLMKLASSLNKKNTPTANGLATIQRIAPNDILGILLKFFTRSFR